MKRALIAGLAVIVAVPMLASAAAARAETDSKYPIPHGGYSFPIRSDRTFSTSLVIPAVKCNEPDARVGFEVVIGGRTGDGVIVGVDVFCDRGVPEYRPFVRTLGEGPRQHLKKPVAPGDAMAFSLTGGSGQVSWQIANGTAGWGVGATQASSLKPTGAVASTSQRRESPTRLYPLADFGRIRYTDTFIDGAPIRGHIWESNMHGFPSGDRLVRTAHFTRATGLGTMTWVHQ